MMTCLAAQERTLKQFEAQLASVGLKVTTVMEYTKELGDSVLVVVPAWESIGSLGFIETALIAASIG